MIIKGDKDKQVDRPLLMILTDQGAHFQRESEIKIRYTRGLVFFFSLSSFPAFFPLCLDLFYSFLLFLPLSFFFPSMPLTSFEEGCDGKKSLRRTGSHLKVCSGKCWKRIFKIKKTLNKKMFLWFLPLNKVEGTL